MNFPHFSPPITKWGRCLNLTVRMLGHTPWLYFLLPSLLNSVCLVLLILPHSLEVDLVFNQLKSIFLCPLPPNPCRLRRTKNASITKFPAYIWIIIATLNRIHTNYIRHLKIYSSDAFIKSIDIWLLYYHLSLHALSLSGFGLYCQLVIGREAAWRQMDLMLTIKCFPTIWMIGMHFWLNKHGKIQKTIQNHRWVLLWPTCMRCWEYSTIFAKQRSLKYLFLNAALRGLFSVPTRENDRLWKCPWISAQENSKRSGW